MKRIDKNVLISVYKRFKRNPLKVFVLKDFFKGEIHKKRKYLNILISLDLIEQVDAKYQFGLPDRKAYRDVKGYKLILKKLKEKGE